MEIRIDKKSTIVCFNFPMSFADIGAFPVAEMYIHRQLTRRRYFACSPNDFGVDPELLQLVLQPISKKGVQSLYTKQFHTILHLNLRLIGRSI